MEESKFRFRVKVVAIVELVFDFLALGALIFIVIVFASTAAHGDPIYYEVKSVQDDDSHGDFGVTIGAIILTIVALFSAASLYFSYDLLRATSFETDTIIALRKAKRWRIFSIVVAVLSLASFGELEYLLSKVIGMIFRLMCIWIVHRYIKDLEIAVKIRVNPPLNSDA